jgi:valyl-tRNA synthetase
MSLQRLDVSSKWIVSRLAATAEEVNASLREYRFNDATHAVYHFVWHELCDWYIEMVKPILYGASKDKQAVQECLLYVLENTLRLLHPFMPYVTEELWQNLPFMKNAISQGKNKYDAINGDSTVSSIVIKPFPRDIPRDPDAEAEMNIIIETVTGIRTIRGELNLSPSLELAIYIKTLNELSHAVLEKNNIFVEKLAKSKISSMGMRVRKPRGSASAVRDTVEVYIPLEGLLDVNLEVERLKKEDAKIDQSLSLVNRKLMNEDFLNKAPKAVVQKEKEKYDAFLKKKEKNMENLKKLHEIDIKK